MLSKFYTDLSIYRWRKFYHQHVSRPCRGAPFGRARPTMQIVRIENAVVMTDADVAISEPHFVKSVAQYETDALTPSDKFTQSDKRRYVLKWGPSADDINSIIDHHHRVFMRCHIHSLPDKHSTRAAPTFVISLWNSNIKGWLFKMIPRQKYILQLTE